MMRRTWFGRLLARWRSNGRVHPPGRGRVFATLTLDTLPDRDSPYSLFVGDVSELSAPTPAVQPSATAAPVEPRPAPTSRADAPPPTLAVNLSAETSDTPAPSSTSGVVIEPIPAAPTPAANSAPPRPVSVPTSTGGPKVDPAGATAGEVIAFRISLPIPPTDNTPRSDLVIRPGDGAVPFAVRPTTPAVSQPTGPVVTTPPTFVGEPAGIVFIVPPVPVVPPPAVVPPGGPTGFDTPPLPTVPPPAPAPAPVPAPAVPPPAPSANDPLKGTGNPVGGSVVPVPVPASQGNAGGQPLQANTPVFRVSGDVKPGETVVFAYTLSSHDSTGTVSASGTATLTAASRVVTITPGAALAGRTADVLTLTVRERGGTRAARVTEPVTPSSATLFVVPVQRVGDVALFEAHRVGQSPEAFRALVQRHGAAVARLSQGIVGNRTDAEDVTQFVFLELAKRQGRFAGTLTGWLRAVARNASLAFLRSKRRRLRHEQASAKPVSAEPTRSIALDDCLIAAIAQLPAELGEAVRLRYVDGYTQQEAADIAGCPRGTLSRRAAYGIQLLRDLLEGERNACELS